MKSSEQRWLHWFAVATCAATLGLIGVGGLVTSKGAGMAVPDWPTTYGYNMFLFPPSQWIGGVFYEHTHRLYASAVGLLTTVLALWLWFADARRWVRWLGVAAFIAVVGQGVLGGLRVRLMIDDLGIYHAAIAQLFLLLTGALGWVTSRGWQRLEAWPVGEMSRALRIGLLLLTALIFVQLMIGATMRHQHAGLAVPDFPLAYGEIWPRVDSESVELANRKRLDSRDFKPITAFHIMLHMTHRIVALCILAAVSWVSWRCWQRFGPRSTLARWAAVWAVLVWTQAVLGAATVWSNKAADVATLHVFGGALALLLGGMLTVTAYRAAYLSDPPMTRDRRNTMLAAVEAGARTERIQ